jgi:hypothetical protein
LDLVDIVRIGPVRSSQLDCISALYVFEPSEETVAMTGNAYISWLPGPCRSGNMTYGVVQRQVIRPVEQRYRKMDLGNLQHCHRGAKPVRKALLVCSDSTLAPAAEVSFRRMVDLEDTLRGRLCV